MFIIYHSDLATLTIHLPICKKLGIVIPKKLSSNPISKYPIITFMQSEIVFPATFIIKQIMIRIIKLVGIDIPKAIKLFNIVLTRL